MRTSGLRPAGSSRSGDSLRFSEGKEAKKKTDAKKCTKAGRGAESPSRVSPQTQEEERQLAERVAIHLKKDFPEKMREIEHHQLKEGGFVPVNNEGHAQPHGTQRSAQSRSPDTLESGGRVREAHSSNSQSKSFLQSSIDGGLKGAVNSNTRPHAPSPNPSQQAAKAAPSKKSPSSEKGSTAPTGVYCMPEVIQPHAQYPPHASLPYPPPHQFPVVHQPIPVPIGYPPAPPMCVGCNHRPALKAKRGFKQSSDASSSRCSAGGLDRARSERSEASLRASLEAIIQRERESGAPIQSVVDEVFEAFRSHGPSGAETSSASPKQEKDWNKLQSKSAFTGSSASYDSYLQMRGISSLPASRAGGSVSSSSYDTASSQGPKHSHAPVYLVYSPYQYAHVMPNYPLQPPT
eukprot:TRINITY_DN9579_c0_g1_i1.p1 TRINITY_DN9579_c0_g1~~TRINITY_DN9579_c0_g1_i1.p1  ORF type:complete len:405 (+),score=125.20 TRINITY_DN9579_c0_g1_i1:54-1268(+)